MQSTGQYDAQTRQRIDPPWVVDGFADDFKSIYEMYEDGGYRTDPYHNPRLRLKSSIRPSDAARIRAEAEEEARRFLARMEEIGVETEVPSGAVRASNIPGMPAYSGSAASNWGGYHVPRDREESAGAEFGPHASEPGSHAWEGPRYDGSHFSMLAVPCARAWGGAPPGSYASGPHDRRDWVELGKAGGRGAPPYE